jgi:hypothetical protein
MPEDVEAFYQVIAQLDACFLNGFVGGQHPALLSLPHVFAGTPLETRIQDSVQALARSKFLEPHFVSLAAARVALQGTLHDMLRNRVLDALNRTPRRDEIPPAPERPPRSSALMDSTRPWLMELAIAGFARLEPNALMSFFPTLSQLQACPATLPLSALLSGFVDAVLSKLPITDAGQIPLLRWCDLWSTAMLNAVGIVEAPEPQPVTGTLYPLGLDLRQHAHVASLALYGVLTGDDGAQFVRQTWSTFKVAAIQGDDVWLLFPEAKLSLQSLLQSKALKVDDMPLLPSGDLLWRDQNAAMGKKYKPLEMALQYCGAGSCTHVTTVPPLERHPVQIAEPVAFGEYRFEDHTIHLVDGLSLPLDPRTALPEETLATSTALFGLLRYDAGRWTIQPLAAGTPQGKFEFAGQAGAEALKKPPKTSSVSILHERSGRLLRR